ncbi:hypothetical protein F5Y12DRAFT_146631 [Xylaria sp. FL1777]|nr:hypothetical protein F5Y12DRAFT_146631 [Xylaria sp. FL1777]
MDLHNTLSKEPSRIPRKPERPYLSSLKPCPMETRRRPLRTYSKRTSTESTEPPLKRRCLTSSSTASVRDKETSLVPPDPEHTATALTLKPPTSLPSTKKGTITAYFGRIIPQPPLVTLSSVPSSDPSSQSNEPTIIPPSSPSLMTAKKRRARRLKTRVVTKRVHEKDDSDEDQENQDDKERMGRIRDIEPPENVRPPALLEATPNALNQGKGVDKARSSGGNPGENRRREKKTASVQTTLSLSMNEAQYTECKECGMLYNHLHKTDVKYHAQRHAALRRAKARTNAKSDVVE